MKKKLYQNPEMEVVRLKQPTLLSSSTCPTQCDTEAGGGGGCFMGG